MVVDRLLIVGLGSIGTRHARLARELLPKAEIVALRRAQGDACPAVDRCVTSLEEALRFSPHAAVLANPAPHHLEAALALTRAGAHLLVEKPLAHASRGVAELIELCRTRGTTLMTGYNLRFLSSLKRFRELVLARRAGRVISVRAEVGQYLPSWRPQSDYRQGVSARADLGGGVLLELSHEIDYLRWVFGEVEWVSCTALRSSRLEIDVEDTAHLVLGFASADEGGLAAALSMDFVRRDSTRSCTAICEEGTLRWDGPAGRVAIFEDSQWHTLLEEAPGRDESYRAEWREFLRAIAGGSPPAVTGEDGLAALYVVEAARRSAASGAVARVAGVANAAVSA